MKAAINLADHTAYRAVEVTFCYIVTIRNHDAAGGFEAGAPREKISAGVWAWGAR
jgi:hypothetical protein